jgi:Ser/Thr protein kinase RdoA (MazF antagonist)
MTNVWQMLDHDTVFKAVEEVLNARLSPLLIQRNSYINRVFELERADTNERFIAKFYRPLRWTKEQVLEEHSFLKELSAKDVPVINPMTINGETLFQLRTSDFELNFCLFPKKGGRSVDEFDEDAWKNIGRHLARIHSAGALHKTSSRITWRPSIATKHHLEVLLASDIFPEDFRKSLVSSSELFIKKSDPLFNDTTMLLLHGDCHKGNLISRPGEGIFLIDFDDMCMGPAVQDLWMLLPGDVEEHKQEFNWFLEGYETFRQFDFASLKLIPALRGMRLIHFASWLAVQSHDPHFDKHFPDVKTPRYWNGLIKEIQAIVYKEEEI